jgi:hypothetical protein
LQQVTAVVLRCQRQQVLGVQRGGQRSTRLRLMARLRQTGPAVRARARHGTAHPGARSAHAVAWRDTRRGRCCWRLAGR